MTNTVHRSYRAIVLAVLLLAATLGGLVPAPAQAVSLGRISGTVTGPGAVPVSGVEVYASQLDGDDSGWVTTSATGTYTIFGLDPGQYLVDFYPSPASGLLSEVYDDASYATPTEVTVAAGLTTSGIDAELSEGGSISGTVTLPDGVDFLDVWVSAGSLDGNSYGDSDLAIDGTYQIDGLAAGDHLVFFEVFGPGAVSEGYDDVRMPLDATLVPVTSGGVTPDIDATLEPCTSPGDFSDVLPNNLFCGDIDWLIDTAITGGYPDGTFRPTAAVTRAAMAAFLYRLEGSPVVAPLGPGECAFTDVCAGHPFESAIVWLSTSGVAGGFADGTFRPGAKVSRQAMASFLHKLAGEPPLPFGPIPPEMCDLFFDDVCGNQFLQQIYWVAFNGIANGYDDGGFHPTSPVSRQAMASFLFSYEVNQQIDELFGTGAGISASRARHEGPTGRGSADGLWGRTAP